MLAVARRAIMLVGFLRLGLWLVYLFQGLYAEFLSAGRGKAPSLVKIGGGLSLA